MRILAKLLKLVLIMAVGAEAALFIRLHHVPHPNIVIPNPRYRTKAVSPAVMEKVRGFTVLISQEGFGGIVRGSGVLIDSTHVLTCAHVAEQRNEEIWVFGYPIGTVVRATVVAESHSLDLAVLVLDRPIELKEAPVFAGIEDGAPVTIVGNILGSMKWFASNGIISGRNNRDLYTDGLVLGGDSGGPWVNDAGEVVAISDWTIERDDVSIGISGGISAESINMFMLEWRIERGTK